MFETFVASPFLIAPSNSHVKFMAGPPSTFCILSMQQVVKMRGLCTDSSRKNYEVHVKIQVVKMRGVCTDSSRKYYEVHVQIQVVEMRGVCTDSSRKNYEVHVQIHVVKI
jgi:hypothetical protein